MSDSELNRSEGDGGRVELTGGYAFVGLNELWAKLVGPGIEPSEANFILSRNARALAEALNGAEARGENRAYAQVVRSARRVYAHPENDAGDARAVMTFAERFLDRAILDDPSTAQDSRR